jgi:hypothetical protein
MGNSLIPPPQRPLSGKPPPQKLILVERKRTWSHQRIAEASFYLTKNGIVWRNLPKGLAGTVKNS